MRLALLWDVMGGDTAGLWLIREGGLVSGSWQASREGTSSRERHQHTGTVRMLCVKLIPPLPPPTLPKNSQLIPAQRNSNEGSILAEIVDVLHL